MAIFRYSKLYEGYRNVKQKVKLNFLNPSDQKNYLIYLSCLFKLKYDLGNLFCPHSLDIMNFSGSWMKSMAYQIEDNNLHG